MNLTPREKDKLLVSVAAMVAARRLERGVKLNYPEAVALICDEVMEEARAGRSYQEVLDHGRSVLTKADVLDGVPELVGMIQVEAVFEDGTKLLTLHRPIQ